MAKILVHKSDINFNAENGDQKKITTATEKFVTNTNIMPKAVFPKAILQKLKISKDAFLFENIEPTGNTSGNVACDSAFHDLMKKRKARSFSQRVKESNSWDKDNWWLFIIGSALLLVALILFQPHSKKYNAEDKQLVQAKEIITTGNWNNNYNAIIPGPLHIDLREWKASYDNKNAIDSLTYLKDSLTEKANEYGNSIRKSAQQKINELENTRQAVRKRIKDSIYVIAQNIINNAGDSVAKNRAAKAYATNEYKKATILLSTIDSLALIANEGNTKEIAFLKTQVDNKYLPDSTITKQISSIKIPTPVQYKYDLLADDTPTETSGWWKFGFWALLLIGGIVMVIFIILVMILFRDLPKVEKDNIQYFADTLRTMAFPGKRSSEQRNNICAIEFNTMSAESIRLLQSVLVRYTWNVLASHDSFEFNEILMKGEALLFEQKQEASEPMFFVHEGDMVIVYAGIGEGENAAIKTNIVLEPFENSHNKTEEKHREM